METKSKYECKHDKDKPRLDLVPPGIIETVGVVRTYGNKKYGDPDGWKRVEPDRYVAALMRHLCEYLRDRNSIDAESGLPHLWHIACNVAFLIELQENKGGVRHMAKRQLSKAEKDYIRAIVEETIPKAADEVVKKAFMSAAEKKQADRKALFKQAEDLLRAKEIMEDNIIEWKQELDRLELGISEKRTASDIVAMANTRLTAEQLLESKIISLQAKIERDQVKLDKLENALEAIRDDKWFTIIEMKYFQEWEDEDIATKLNCDKRTVWRHKSRLVWKVALKLFGGELIG